MAKRTHDYSSHAESDARTRAKHTVELVVRDRERYGDARPGDRVVVDRTELNNPSTMSACMTLEDEQSAARAKRVAKSAAAAAAPPKVKAMVEDGLARLHAQAEAKAKIDAAEAKRLSAEPAQE